MSKEELIESLCNADHRNELATTLTVEWLELVQEKIWDEDVIE